MHIAVLGSWKEANIHSQDFRLKLDLEMFKIVCKRIGAYLNSEGHWLVTALEDEKTADRYVKEGFNNPSKIDQVGSTLNGGDKEAAHNLAAVRSQAVIIIGGAIGSYNAGLMAINENKLVIPIPCFGGAAELLLSNPIDKEFPKAINSLCNLRDTTETNIDVLIKTIGQLLDSYPRILIIHGRSKDKDDLIKLLKNGITDEKNKKIKNYIAIPKVLSKTEYHAEPVTTAFERHTNMVNAAIAVITPDDLGASVLYSNGDPILAQNLLILSKRARQNVWLEVGYCWGKLPKDNLMLLAKGKFEEIEIPSDLKGVKQSCYNDLPSEKKNDIYQFIKDIRDGKSFAHFNKV